MTLEVEFWTLVSVSVTFLGAIVGLVWGLIRSVLNQAMRRLDDRFVAMDKSQRAFESDLSRRLQLIEQAGREEAAQWTRIERELLNLKADLPISYVRREDYVTAIATIMTKLDSMSLRFENILLKGGKAHDY